MIQLIWIFLMGSIFSQPVFQVISPFTDATPLISPPPQTSQVPIISFAHFDGDGTARAVNEADQIGDIFHSLYESVLFGQRQHVSFKIKSTEGVVYLYDLLCERSGHCDVKIQSRTKNRKVNPAEALNLFLKENGDVQFIQPVLKVRDTSSDILQTLKGTNEKLKLVDELWSKTYKMKDIGDKKRAQFALEVLRAHNKLREHHGTESLTLEKKLMEDAQNYAERCARSGSIVPRDQMSPYGENIWGLTTNASDLDDLHGGRPVEKWYSESRNYTFGEEPKDISAGHLTQLLWSKTKYLGVGIAANDNGQIFVICEYHPPGNYLGDYAANVKPLQKPFTNEDAAEISIPSLAHLSISNSSNLPTTPSSISARNTTKTSTELSRIRSYTLQFHNEKRILHSLKALNYTHELESLAQEWAEHLLKNGTFYHRPDNIYGENIYFYTASFYLDDKASIKKAVDAWYDEIDFYKSFDKEPTVEELTTGNPTGHFTQVVWNSTTNVGLGIARQDSENSHLVVVVANYAPGGNVLGRFKDNVSRPVAWYKNVSQDVKNVTKHKAPAPVVKEKSPSEVLDENVALGASFENLLMSDFMKNVTPTVSVQNVTSKRVISKGGKNMTSQGGISKDSKVTGYNVTSKAETSKDALDKKVTSKIDSARNVTKIVNSGSDLSTKTGTSENDTIKSSNSKVVIRREVRGLRMFSERVAQMSSTPVCPEK